MRGSLLEIEVIQARAGQIEAHKKREISRKSLSKGGSLIASNALQKIAEKRRKEADKILKKATIALTCAVNKQNGDLK
jgi:hypothetical protein